jgi:hypothetical protein
MSQLVLKRSPLGPDQNQEEYDVIADGAVVGRISGVRGAAMGVDPSLWLPGGQDADARLRSYARGRHDGVCEKLAAERSMKVRFPTCRLPHGSRCVRRVLDTLAFGNVSIAASRSKSDSFGSWISAPLP